MTDQKIDLNLNHRSDEVFFWHYTEVWRSFMKNANPRILMFKVFVHLIKLKPEACTFYRLLCVILLANVTQQACIATQTTVALVCRVIAKFD